MREEHTKKLVTVIIPAYNAGKFINETIASVFDQSYRPIELLLIDDGSTDNTEEIALSWIESTSEDSEFKLQYIRQQNSGAQTARNRGLSESKGEFIQYLDADDLIHKDKIAIQVNCLNENMDCGFVYSYTAGINQNSDLISKLPISGWTLENRNNNNQLLGGSLWHPHSGIFRRSTCLKLGYWNESIELWQDWEYSVELGYLNERIIHIPKILSYYRIYDNANRISQRVNKTSAFDRGFFTMRQIKERMRKNGKHSKRDACLLSTSMMRLITLAIKNNNSDNVRIIQNEVEELNPCLVCKSRLVIMVFIYKSLGYRAYLTIFKVIKKITHVSYKIWHSTSRLFGCRRHRAPRISIHL